jgi:hypothetical protein
MARSDTVVASAATRYSRAAHGGRGMSRDVASKQVTELCHQAEAMIAALGLARAFILPQLHARVQERRGRPLHLIPRDVPALAPHGLWVAGEHGDYVFYDRAAGPVRQHQIIGHELGHMLFDDQATPAGLTELAAMLTPDVDLTVATNLQQRTHYHALPERRAEMFGTVVLHRLESWAPLPAGVDPALLARLVATLGGGDGPR